MRHCEALYGRKCNTPISCNDSMSRVILGLDMLKEMEYEITTIRNNLKTYQDMQKSYEDKWIMHKEFQVGDMSIST